MSAHEHTRLEYPGGTVISYLAPQFEVHPQAQNAVQTVERPGATPQRAYDKQLWSSELVVQGAFEHSDNLPKDHVSALRAPSMFNQVDVTAVDQINRIYALTVYGQPGPYYLYHGEVEYTAETEGEIDVGNGVYPAVQLEELRHPQQAGLDRSEYMLRFSVGVDD